MPFDEEELDPHGECRAEIHQLMKERAAAVVAERERCARAILNCPGLTDDEKRIAVNAIQPR